jgi:hypothetical protein
MGLSRLLIALAVAAPAGAAAAQSAPDFSGTWRLVPERSDFGGGPAAISRTDVIEHREPRLAIRRTISNPGETPVTATLTYAVDGKPYTNEIGGSSVTSTLAWDGPVLVMKSTVPTPQGDAELTDRFTLSANGDTLTMRRAIAVQGQELSQTMVFARQKG